MRDKDYPVFPPEGVFYFPDVMCLIKKSGNAEITRIDKNKFKVMDKARVCRMKEDREMTISENNSDNIYEVQDEDILRVGNTAYNVETNVITLSAYKGDSWDNAFTIKDTGLPRKANTYNVLPKIHFLPGVYFIFTNECIKMNCIIDPGAHIKTQEVKSPKIEENKLIDALVLNALELNIIKESIKEVKADTDKIQDIQAKTDKIEFLDNNIQARVNNKGVLHNPPSEKIEDYKANVANLDTLIETRAVEANAQGHVLAALNEYKKNKEEEIE